MKIRVRGSSQSYILAATPIIDIVSAFKAFDCKIAHFVSAETRRQKPAVCLVIKIRSHILVGQRNSSLALHHAVKASSSFHRQPVSRNVFKSCRDDNVESFVQPFGRFVRQPQNYVRRNISYSASGGTFHCIFKLRQIMRSVEQFQCVIVGCLQSDAEPVDAASCKQRNFRLRSGIGIALYGYFRSCFKHAFFRDELQKVRKQRGVHRRRCASAEIHGVYFYRTALLPDTSRQLFFETGKIFRHHVVSVGIRTKIAVNAPLSAKRYMNIKSRHQSSSIFRIDINASLGMDTLPT